MDLVRIASVKDTESREFCKNAINIAQIVTLGIQIGVLVLSFILANSPKPAEVANSVVELIPKK